jgi:TRAP-type C4-dicarboxylate transport system substrate-binding protein
MIRLSRSRAMVFLAAAATTVTGIWAAGSASGAPVTLEVGYVTTPAHPYGRTLQQFKQLVESATAGPDQVTIKLTPGYGGGDDIKLLQDIKGGAVAGGGVSTAVFPTAGIRAFNALQLPGLVNSYELERGVIANSSGVAQGMLRIVTKNTPLTAVGLFEGGMRQITLKGPIAKLSDLKGQKIRVPQSPLIADIYSALGVDPIDKKLGEVAQALGATGAAAVTGIDANSALIRAQQFDVAGIRDIVIANTFPFPAAVVFNDGIFNSLTPGQQTAIKAAATNMAAYSLTVNDQSGVQAALCSGAGGRPKVTYQQLSLAGLKAFNAAEAPVIKKYTQSDKQTRAFYTSILKKKVALLKKQKTDPTAITATDQPPASCLGAQVGP